MLVCDAKILKLVLNFQIYLVNLLHFHMHIDTQIHHNLNHDTINLH